MASILFGSLCCLFAFEAGWCQGSSFNQTQLDRVVAMSWGDGKYGPAFYGAHVYLEPLADGFSVRARVQVGRGNPMFHDCGELGIARTAAEAVARWGTIEFRDDGLHLGRGPDAFFLPRERMEAHR